MDLQVRLKPNLGIEEEVHVLHADVARYPRTVDNHGHGDLIQFFETGGFLEDFPLSGFHVVRVPIEGAVFWGEGAIKDESEDENFGLNSGILSVNSVSELGILCGKENLFGVGELPITAR